MQQNKKNISNVLTKLTVSTLTSKKRISNLANFSKLAHHVFNSYFKNIFPLKLVKILGNENCTYSPPDAMVLPTRLQIINKENSS